jgi:hypothetical protein
VIENLPDIFANNGPLVAVIIYLFWERQRTAETTQEERNGTLRHLEKAIKTDLVEAIRDLKEEIIKLNARTNGGRKL